MAATSGSYLDNRTGFFKLVESEGFDWADKTHRRLLMSMLMTASDIFAVARPWAAQKVKRSKYGTQICRRVMPITAELC